MGRQLQQRQNATAFEQCTKSATMTQSVPLDETIEELTHIWQDLLGMEFIAPDQNYFDLGGDSPLAVQLFARIESRFQVKLPLATLFEAPTIVELAQILRREMAPSGWSSIVPIQPKGLRPRFFCVHPHGGNVLIYRDLSRHLGADQPFYGLQSRGLDGSCPPLSRIEDMAALYVKDMQSVQPHGPYFLGGFCMGGTVAYEMAQQLLAAGEEIALLAFVDTLNWGGSSLPSLWEKSLHTSERLRFHISNFLSLDTTAKKEFFREKVKALRTRIPVWRTMLLGKLFKNSGLGTSETRVLGQIWKSNFQACLDYFPQPYPGVVTDIRPAKQFRSYKKPELKWDQLARSGQVVVVLPVNPAGMLVEPFVKHLAIALQKSIDGAMQNLENKSASKLAQTSNALNDRGKEVPVDLGLH